jgi:hypothetical protein
VATAGTAVAVESVRVEMAAGVPRLTVDGKPVRGRIFWGRPAGAVVVARPRAKPALNRVAAFDRPRRVFSLVATSSSSERSATALPRRGTTRCGVFCKRRPLTSCVRRFLIGTVASVRAGRQ